MPNAEPAGWAIRVATKPGFTDSFEVLKKVSETLTADEALHSAVPTLDGTGTLEAVVTVEEAREARATEIAVAAFYRALDAAGFDTKRPGWELLVDVMHPLPAE